MNDTLTPAIVGHLVGDYLLQTDWMAIGKKKSSGICVIHCFLWTVSVMFFSGWMFLRIPQDIGRWQALMVVGILMVCHFVQDRTQIINWWMRLPWKDQSQFMRCDDLDLTDYKIVPGLGPWSIIVVDNVWHIVTIWLVWRYFIV